MTSTNMFSNYSPLMQTIVNQGDNTNIELTFIKLSVNGSDFSENQKQKFGLVRRNKFIKSYELLLDL